jgi:hypothetical protein
MMRIEAEDIVAFFCALPTKVRAEIDVLAERDRALGEDLEDGEETE